MQFARPHGKKGESIGGDDIVGLSARFGPHDRLRARIGQHGITKKIRGGGIMTILDGDRNTSINIKRDSDLFADDGRGFVRFRVDENIRIRRRAHFEASFDRRQRFFRLETVDSTKRKTKSPESRSTRH